MGRATENGKMTDTGSGNFRRGSKSAAAFRTISEVAGDLDVPPHVLRFWETKFSQVKPLKRGGGRRDYRPEDVALLRRIRELLYDEGYTIKGVQRLLRDGLVKPAAVIESPPDGVPPTGSVENPGEVPTTATALRSILQDLRRVRGDLAAAKGPET